MTDIYKWDPYWIKPFEERTLLGTNMTLCEPDTVLLARLITELDSDDQT